MRLPEKFEVKIEELVFGGEGLGYYNNRPIFVFGALPGEQVLVRPIKVRRKFTKAAPIEILEPSPERIAPKSDHSLTCSPWQILPYKNQLAYKEELTNKMWQHFTKTAYPKTEPIAPSPAEFGYRNKLEFSFNLNEGGTTTLAFHRRYRYNQFFNLKECLLGADPINIVGNEILNLLNNNQIPIEDLKNLTLRYSFYQNKVLATLFVVNQNFPKLEFTHPLLAGWRISYSNPQSPMAAEDFAIHADGDDFLVEQMHGKTFKYGRENFFQVNPPAFEKLLDFVQPHLKDGNQLVDLYSGVGTLGIALGDKFQNITFVEKDATAKAFNEENLVSNKLSQSTNEKQKNIQILSGESEKQNLEEILQNTDTLIIDPPRAGMHPKVLKRIIEAKPKQIVYVSCNPTTQARDMLVLSEHYNAKAGGLFDLYPQTPHVESVLIMESK